MTHDEKIKFAKEQISRAPSPAAVLCSFGKDSMALLHLIREVYSKNELSCHEYPVPVINHRHPWFGFKNEFANSVTQSWSLETHDYPPMHCGIKCNEHRLELVARYPFGEQGMDLPLNTEAPVPRRDFVCGVEWLQRPKISGVEWKWRSIFHGHKSSDVDPFEGSVPLTKDYVYAAGVRVVFPLRHWTDDDVWQYIEDNGVPYDKRRYQDRRELDDKWANPDYIHACTRCIDPRESAEVECPKLGRTIPNVSDRVLRLEGLPDYIRKEA